jgi:hypothetical protein
MQGFRFEALAAGQARLAAVLPLMVAVLASPASAAPCKEFQAHLLERKNLVSSIQAMTKGGKKMDPKAACATLGRLGANGSTTLKSAETNTAWCQAPDQFVQGLTADHDNVTKLRGHACEIASKQDAMKQKSPALEFMLRPGAPDLMPGWLRSPAQEGIPWAIESKATIRTKAATILCFMPSRGDARVPAAEAAWQAWRETRSSANQRRRQTLFARHRGLSMQRSRTHAQSALTARLARAGLVAAALPFILPALVSPAQASPCMELQTHLLERKNLVSSIQAMTKGGKKMDPKAACAAFGKLVSNGSTTLKWAETNKDWCQVPDQFVQGLKADHDNVTKMRGRACEIASKQAEMEKKGAAGQGGGLLGGGGLEGTYRIPQGAL